MTFTVDQTGGAVGMILLGFRLVRSRGSRDSEVVAPAPSGMLPA